MRTDRAERALAVLLISSTLLCCAHRTWVTSWGASPQPADEPESLSRLTVREVVRLSLGGDGLRVRLSNAFGTRPIAIGAVAIRVASVDRPITFGGAPSVELPPGEARLSDQVALAVPDGCDVTISLFFPGEARAETEHSIAMSTTSVSPPGDFTAADFTVARTTESLYLATDIEVFRGGARAVVVLGDSLTDGVGSTMNANRRWPNLLAVRLNRQHDLPPTAVVDEGIAGNRVLHEFLGPSALERLDRDVLSKAGARYVIVLEGLNDFGIPGAFERPAEKVPAEALIAGHQELVRRIHAKGLKAYGGTLMPFEGATTPGYYSDEGEAARQAVNGWLRTSNTYDAIIDFDAVMRDPAQPTRLRAELDSGDHLHPNDAGYQAMADAVDVALFR